MTVIAGIFVTLHGLVHLWYVTLSQRWVAFQPEMGWTGSSWLLGDLSGNVAGRGLASALYTLCALAMVVSGLGLMTKVSWFEPALIISAGFSSAVILVFWDGGTEMLVQKGLLGLLINLGLIGAVLLTR